MNKKQQYYLDQFKKIDLGKFSWNWTAFAFPLSWSMYRKIYSYAFKLLILYFVGFLITLLIHESFFWWSICLSISTGIKGNRVYYTEIKRKLSLGYQLCEYYKPTNRVLLYLIFLHFIESLLFSTTADITSQIADPATYLVISFFHYITCISYIILTVGILISCFYSWFKDQKIPKLQHLSNPKEKINEQNILKLI